MDLLHTRRRFLALWLALALMFTLFSSPALAYDTDTPEDLSDSDITAASAILIDGHTGRVLYSKDAHTKRYPASTTKIMTLMIALENVSDLDETITIPKEANEYPEGSSLVGLYTGEEMTWRTLLTTFFICSGNDAGIAIAVLVAGDESSFVDMMNARAQELGCDDTHFANPHGFHDPDHYTTASDLATIALEAMKNETFREIASTTHYTIPANNKRSEETTKWTKNQFIARNDTSMKYKYQYGTGIKTGYTSKAGSTFVGSASKDGVDLISVVLLSTTEGKWIDSIRLMNYGFATYESYDPVALYRQNPLTVSVSDADPQDASGGVLTLDVQTPESSDPVCARPSEVEQIESDFSSMLTVSYSREMKAPISEGEVVGTLTYNAPDGEKYDYTLIAANSIASAPTATEPVPTEIAAAADTGDASNSGGTKVWLIPIIAVMVVLIIMVLINSARARARKQRRYARRNYDYSGDYDTRAAGSTRRNIQYGQSRTSRSERADDYDDRRDYDRRYDSRDEQYDRRDRQYDSRDRQYDNRTRDRSYRK